MWVSENISDFGIELIPKSDKFYSSFESLFLPQYEKKYFIFTDYPLKSSTNVQVSFQEDLGWPKNVLFRYQMFFFVP